MSNIVSGIAGIISNTGDTVPIILTGIAGIAAITKVNAQLEAKKLQSLQQQFLTLQGVANQDDLDLKTQIEKYKELLLYQKAEKTSEKAKIALLSQEKQISAEKARQVIQEKQTYLTTLQRLQAEAQAAGNESAALTYKTQIEKVEKEIGQEQENYNALLAEANVDTSEIDSKLKEADNLLSQLSSTGLSSLSSLSTLGKNLQNVWSTITERFKTAGSAMKDV